MSMPVVKTVTLRNDDTLVENNQQVPFGTVVWELYSKSPILDLIMLLGKLMTALIVPIKNIFID